MLRLSIVLLFQKHKWNSRPPSSFCKAAERSYGAHYISSSKRMRPVLFNKTHRPLCSCTLSFPRTENYTVFKYTLRLLLCSLVFKGASSINKLNLLRIVNFYWAYEGSLAAADVMNYRWPSRAHTEILLGVAAVSSSVISSFRKLLLRRIIIYWEFNK